MNRDEFLKKRQIAHHLKTKGAIKVPPGEAHGAVLHKFRRGIRAKTADQSNVIHPQDDFETKIDEESGEAVTKIRKYVPK